MKFDVLHVKAISKTGLKGLSPISFSKLRKDWNTTSVK